MLQSRKLLKAMVELSARLSCSSLNRRTSSEDRFGKICLQILFFHLSQVEVLSILSIKRGKEKKRKIILKSAFLVCIPVKKPKLLPFGAFGNRETFRHFKFYYSVFPHNFKLVLILPLHVSERFATLYLV